MEFFLNSAWALLSIVIVALWLRREQSDDVDRRLSFVSLVMLIVILFPVISVSDDLWSIQNPAETDTCLRRDHLASCAHAIFPAMAALPEPVFAVLTFGFQRLTAPLNLPVRAVDNPAFDAIQNRPPPAA
ncbi:MAG: hypothetical protein WBM14_11325 [Terracidiphilus sp.]